MFMRHASRDQGAKQTNLYLFYLETEETIVFNVGKYRYIYTFSVLQLTVVPEWQYHLLDYIFIRYILYYLCVAHGGGCASDQPINL